MIGYLTIEGREVPCIGRFTHDTIAVVAVTRYELSQIAGQAPPTERCRREAISVLEYVDAASEVAS